eukprot:s2072_g22.t2
MTDPGASLRYFSGGDDIDYREYRRWRQWAVNRMNVMDKLPVKARGSFVWTLLQGRALEIVEHLKEEEYQCEGGDQVIFALLDQRWPQKDRSDEMGEHISEIFNLKAKQGETVRQWCGRARECFDRCKRKTGVNFPDEARGWILLQCSGMNEEQRAVVLARTQGELKFDSMALSMRSCCPDFTVPKRRSLGAHMVETKSMAETMSQGADDEPPHDAAEFQDIELFLAEYAGEHTTDDTECYDEQDVADILQVSWREKRQELARLKQSRQFTKETDTRRAFRIEVEELKKKTRCHKCKKLGHWARECKSRGPPSQATSSGSGAHGASCVQNLPEEHFICTAEWHKPMTTLERLRVQFSPQSEVTVNPVMLVSSPGFAILDSGCGKTIVGANTLKSFRELWTKANVPQPTARSEENLFRYGNGACEKSSEVIEMPICLAERRGVVQAAIVQGDAPLLLSRPAMKKLEAEMNFHTDELKLFKGKTTVPMSLNSAGQYMVAVSNFEPKENSVCMTVHACEDPMSAAHDEPADLQQHDVVPPPPPEVSVVGKKGKSKDYWVVNYAKGEVVRHHVRPRTERFTPCNTNCPVNPADLSADRVTQWRHHDAQHMHEIRDDWTFSADAHAHVGHDATKYWLGQTTFFIRPENPMPPGTGDEVLMKQWSPKQARQLAQHVKRLDEASKQPKRYDVIEVFSPPRFAQRTAIRGQTCLSADLLTGWDFRRADHRKSMREIVKNTPPELLLCCPPCTWAGGWFHLNQLYMDPSEVEKRRVLTMLFINFCCELIELQLDSGGHALLEHPKPSMIWKLPRVQRLMERMHLIECDMCRFGLKIPHGSLIKKSTRLLVSHANMKRLGLKCPGHQHPDHQSHQPVAGSHPEVGCVSRFAGQYPPRFVRAVMDCVPNLRGQAVLSVACHHPTECLVAARVRELNEGNDAKIRDSLQKLHINLGHPGSQHLVRLLKHGGASQRAQELAKELQCAQCLANAKPSPALPAQPERITVFNQRIGIDVKWLTGWSVNQKIASLNIVDYASSFQIVVPLFERPTSENLRKVVQERWISWAGQPSEIICDPHRVNLSDVLTTPQELSGSTIHVTAADAPYQLGKVEVHGGWFNQVLEKTIHEFSPNTKEAWLECVSAAHCKNELIQVYGMTPAQFLFGRNPKIPENLMDEPLEVVPATAALYEEEVARRVSVRHAARRAVLELQDSKALRLALAARPRHQKEPEPGQLVAYWRTQKWEQGQLNNQGRWHGPAIVLGKVGRNFVVVHKRQVIRCAPEQIRAATSEERELVRAPHAELLGLKHAFEAGQIASRQYVDLIPQGYPTEGSPVAVQPDAQEAALSLSDRANAEPVVASPAAVPPAETAPDALGVEGSSLSSNVVTSEEQQDMPDKSPEESSTYGPVRRRLRGKNGPSGLFRPAPMLSEDFAEMMQEIVPQLMDKVLEPGADPPDATMSSPRSHGVKRPASPSAAEEQGHAQVPRLESSGSDGDSSGVVNVGSVEHVSSACCELSEHDRSELVQMYEAGVPFEVMLVSYHQKRGSKEIPHTNQEPEHQKKIDEAKLAEWHVIEGKGGGRLVHGSEAEHVRHKLSHRIMDSRYVVTLKQEEDSPVKIKARWCLLGHRDPDLSTKALAGALQSPTLSQVSRSVLFQTIASKKWQLALGDIKGAFLSAGPLPEKYRPLYARLPPGGIPGVPSDALIEITGHVYGLNDSPSAWQQKLHRELLSVGFVASRFDPCLYTLRDASGELCGICGVHVDDCATGGAGKQYEQAMVQLKQKFEFRKWRFLDGDFCGARYTQDPVTFEISMSQSKFASGIRPLHMSRSRCQDKTALLSDQEVSCLRAINGSLNWLSSQSRPDLAAQVSFSQQSFSHPNVGDALAANNAIRRARQHADLCIVYRSIPLSEIAESADALDLLRACVKAGKYQISPEQDVLEWRANERQRRKEVAEKRAKFCAYLVSTCE